MSILDTKMLIIALFKKDKLNYLTVNRLQKFMLYLYKELIDTEQLYNYDINFDIDINSIEQAVLYNSHLFEMDKDRDIIYLKGNINEYHIDNIIISYLYQYN